MMSHHTVPTGHLVTPLYCSVLLRGREHLTHLWVLAVGTAAGMNEWINARKSKRELICELGMTKPSIRVFSWSITSFRKCHGESIPAIGLSKHLAMTQQGSNTWTVKQTWAYNGWPRQIQSLLSIPGRPTTNLQVSAVIYWKANHSDGSINMQ